MSIKSLAAVALTSTLVFVGCSKEDEPAHEPIVVELKGGADCLANIGGYFSDYVNGRMSASEVDAFWDCSAKAIRDYRRLTAGEHKSDRYEPQAIRRFIQRYFIKHSTIGDGLLASLMEVKRLFLSGTNGEITRAELDRLNELLLLLKEVCRDLNPHVRVVFLRERFATDREVAEGARAFSGALQKIGTWLDRYHQDYSFAELARLVNEMEAWKGAGEDADSEDADDLFAVLKKGLDVLPPSKKILLGGDPAAISGADWVPLMRSLGEGYHAFLAFRFAFAADLNSGMMREALPLGILAAERALRRGLEAHPEKTIPLLEIEELFGAAIKTGWFPEEFTLESLKTMWLWLLKRPLGMGREPAPAALTLEHLDALKERFALWANLQRSGGRTQKTAEDFERVISRSPPLEWDVEGRMSFPEKPSKEWSEESRLRLVWPYVIIDWIKDAYVGLEAEAMNDEQITLAVEEILPVLQGFGWLQTTQTTIGKKLLRESDLFTASSDGDGMIQVHEAVRYLAYVASAFRAAEVWLAETRVLCGGRAADCLRLAAAEPKLNVLSSLPRLRRAFADRPAADFAAYTRAAEETILEEAVEGEFSTSDLLQVWMIFQYVENFTQRFDVNGSESVDLQESAAAYELFGPTLGNLLSSTGLPEEDLLAFFTFLMKYGDTPFTMFGGQVLWLHWKWHQNDWAFESGRETLMGILKQLSKL